MLGRCWSCYTAQTLWNCKSDCVSQVVEFGLNILKETFGNCIQNCQLQALKTTKLGLVLFYLGSASVSFYCITNHSNIW